MQLNQVRYFLEAARLVNFTKAAEMCGVTQPALTKGIKSLEDELGGALFHRAPKLCLTDLGRSVLPFIQQTFEAATAVRQQAQSYKTGAVVPISIGIDQSVQSAVIIPILTELKRVFSGLTLRLHSAPSDALMSQMLNGEIDILLRPYNNAANDRHPLHHLPFVTEKLAVVFSPGHPFSRANQLDTEEILTAQDRIRFCEQADRILEELGTIAPPRHWAATIDQVDDLLDMDMGWTLLPADHPVATRHEQRTLPNPDLVRTIEFVYAAGRPHGLATAAFLRLAKMGPRPTGIKA